MSGNSSRLELGLSSEHRTERRPRFPRRPRPPQAQHCSQRSGLLPRRAGLLPARCFAAPYLKDRCQLRPAAWNNRSLHQAQNRAAPSAGALKAERGEQPWPLQAAAGAGQDGAGLPSSCRVPAVLLKAWRFLASLPAFLQEGVKPRLSYGAFFKIMFKLEVLQETITEFSVCIRFYSFYNLFLDWLPKLRYFQLGFNVQISKTAQCVHVTYRFILKLQDAQISSFRCFTKRPRQKITCLKRWFFQIPQRGLFANSNHL